MDPASSSARITVNLVHLAAFRSRFSLLAAVALGPLGFAAPAVEPVTASRATKPNIVFILADDLFLKGK